MLEYLKIEYMCAREFARLICRDSRYLGLTVSMYGRTLNSPTRAQMLRAAYCLARLIDDVLDGDIIIPGDPEVYVFYLMHQAKAGMIAGRNLPSRLGRFVFENINRFGRNSEIPAEYLHVLVESMLIDRRRARKKLLLSDRQLHTHLVKTLEAAHNAALCISNARARAPDIPHLIRAQASLYTLRDLKTDISRGLVNIPEDVVTLARDQGCNSLSYDALFSTSAVKKWIADEFAFGRGHLEAAGHQLAAIKDRRTSMIVRPLHRGLKHLARRLPPVLGVDISVNLIPVE